jgi:hypothetical protein
LSGHKIALAAVAALAAASRLGRRGSAASDPEWLQKARALYKPETIEAILAAHAAVAEQQASPLVRQARYHGRAPVYGWLYDSLGRSYRVLYRVIATRTDGTGPVLASNLPGSLRSTPGYPPQFQARSLERGAERRKIELIAKNLDPMRLLTPHVDPTVGAPVTWLSHGGDGTEAGVSYVLGGNGRTIALLMASDETYQEYVNLAQALWSDIWPEQPAPRGHRYLVVRQVYPSLCLRSDMDPQQTHPSCHLSFRSAVELAGATQASLAARETPLGEALSVVRSLGLDPVGIAKEVPLFRWEGTVARDNVDAFMSSPDTLALRTWLSRTMGLRAYDDWTSDPDNAAKLFRSILIGFLPREVILGGFGSLREEQALMSALPTLAQLAISGGQKRIDPAWSLLPHLPDARLFVNEVRGKSMAQTMNAIKRMAQQQTLDLRNPMNQKIKVLSERLTPEAILLGLTLKRGEQARDPSIPVEDVLRRYQAASEEGPPPAAIGLFGAPPPPDVPLALGTALAESYSGAGAEPIRVVTYRSLRQ